LFISSTK